MGLAEKKMTEYRYLKSEPEITFRWYSPEYLKQFRLTVAKDPAFNDVLITEDSVANRATVTVDHDGLLYWKVEGKSDTEYKQTSSIQSIKLTMLDVLEPPTLLFPKVGAILTKKWGEDRTVSFQWARLEDVKTYLIEVSNSKDFSDHLVKEQIKGNRFQSEFKDLERLYWRVSATDVDGNLVEGQVVRQFSLVSSDAIDLRAPADGKKFEYISDVPDTKMFWSGDPQAEHYEIELASDISFSKHLRKVSTQQTELAISNLEEGLYFWRISAFNSAGQPFRASKVRSFQIRAKDRLKPPILLLPDPGYTRPSITPADVSLSFKWKPITKAVSYELSIEKLDGGRDPASEGALLRIDDPEINQKVEQNAIVLKRFEPGTYAWGVRSVDLHGRLGRMSRVRQFTVSSDNLPLAAPRLHKPIIKRRVKK